MYIYIYNIWRSEVKWSESHSVMSNSLLLHGLYSPWNSPGQNMGVGSHSLLQGIFPTQGLNPSLSHCRHILCQLSNKGSPIWHLYILYVTFIHIWQIPMWNIWHLGIILKKKIKIICKSKSDYSKHFSVYLLSMCLCVSSSLFHLHTYIFLQKGKM